MNSYSLLHVWRDFETGDLHRVTYIGQTYLSVEAAFACKMGKRKHYPPTLNEWWEVAENWIAPKKVYKALPYAERVKWRALYGGTGPLFAY